MRFIRLAPALLAPALVFAMLTGPCATAFAQSRSGIDSAPLLPPAGVGTPDYPAPAGRAPPPEPPQPEPYLGIYGIGAKPQGQPQQQPVQSSPPAPPSGQAQVQPGQLRPQRSPYPPAPGAPSTTAPSGTAPAGAAPSAPGAPAAPADSDALVVQPPAEKIANPTAVYAGLDKITGRITSFEVAMGETVQFGALQVTPRACYTRPPTEPQNTTSFTEVNEITLQGEAKRIFTGWMFASSPGLHGVEHPIYDVWLTDCKATAPSIAKPGAQK